MVPVMAFALYSCNDRNKSPSTQRTPAEDAAIKSCAELVRERATFPSSVDIHYVTGVGSDLGGVGGKPRVALSFDAKNGLGNMLPYLASCDFSTDPPQVTISNR